MLCCAWSSFPVSAAGGGAGLRTELLQGFLSSTASVRLPHLPSQSLVKLEKSHVAWFCLRLQLTAMILSATFRFSHC